MRIDGTLRESMGGGLTAQASDPISKNLRAQIANAQKQLQELAANKDMEPEEKMERRKEIQQQITDLNAQLRQHEMELRKEKQQQVRQSAQARKQEAERAAENAPGKKPDAGPTKGSMEAMISAERAVGQAKVQGNVASAMKSRANVLKSEIEHSARGAATEKKQESVADIEKRMEELAKEQAQGLNRAGEELAEAAKDARAERKAEKEKQEEEEQEKHGEAGTYAAGEGKYGWPETGTAGNTGEKTAPAGRPDRGEEEPKAWRQAGKEGQDAEERADFAGESGQIQVPRYRKVDILL